MSVERIIGFILLLLGVVIILYALYASYGIFTGGEDPPEIFEASQATGVVSEELQKQLESLLPDEALPKTFNLFAWSILAGILIFGGGQVAGLGVKLLKK